MTKPDTRHLDTALSILRGTGASKRAPRIGTEMSVYLTPTGYTIQVNGKVLADAPGTEADARADAEARATRLRALTKKTVSITCYPTTP